ncbi:pyruvate, water dikinase regulatory protein [Sulfobacillus harzensis]|uniref:Putative pyruvate, phosphate dikinase regulatory protein n=1 Tax=Sulfobacillus harzensis TaxID=2729629 RepID=A0A7Y0L4N5_9FIRM|nr:pyruvate, water dikinase regulatory protein [Sulfobacillus harzensis]NMP23023.1 kinase/pyrophosphorylase [Sulfobacillus harzensis]
MQETRVYILSDSLGETAERVAHGAAIQFESAANIKVERVPYVVNQEGIDRVLSRAVTGSSVIVYTMVRPELREYLDRAAEARNIPHVDVMGPVLSAFERVVQSPPRLIPGLSHRLDQEYFARVEAMEFAVKYDDGKDPKGIREADVVLLGVSRTSKTPVSLYLANHRLKVANVPLVPEVPVPSEVFREGRLKTVGLIIKPELLMSIRRQRLKSLGLGTSSQYATMDRIMVELDYAWDIFNRLKCPVIDVSNHAVEETATRVLELRNKEALAE